LASRDTVYGDLSISNNSSLTQLQDLQFLQEVTGSLFIDRNSGLSNLLGLSALTTVLGDLNISENAGLLDLQMFPGGGPTPGPIMSGITFVGGNLSIIGNTNLEVLAGLGFLESVGGEVLIQSNPDLHSLGGLDHLSWVQSSLTISDNDTLGSIVELGWMTTMGLIIGGPLTITNNPMLCPSQVTDLSTHLGIQCSCILTTYSSGNGTDQQLVCPP